MKTNLNKVTLTLSIMVAVVAFAFGGLTYFSPRGEAQLASKTDAVTTASKGSAAFSQSKPLPSNQHLPRKSSDLTKRQDVTIKYNDALGSARFITVEEGHSLYPGGVSNYDTARGFLTEHGAVFGISDPDQQLLLESDNTDEYGTQTFKYQQKHEGLDVFAGKLMLNFDEHGNLVAANGNVIPDINVNTHPSLTDAQAEEKALAMSARFFQTTQQPVVTDTQLLVYRTKLDSPDVGHTTLSYQVTVTNFKDVNENIYINAHHGKLVDTLTNKRFMHGEGGVQRRAYDLNDDLANILTVYPDSPVWVEGDPFPTGDPDIDRTLQATKETYDIMLKAFGIRSFDNKNSVMDVAVRMGIFNAFSMGNSYPLTVYGPGTAEDEITAHEWGHHYTAFSDRLIYRNQPGAINESYSDILGETVDILNKGKPFGGLDEPDNPRTDGACTISTGNLLNSLTVNSPVSIADDYVTAQAGYGPPNSGETADVVYVNDGSTDNVDAGGTGVFVGTLNDGCTPSGVDGHPVWTPDVNGKIAMIDRGACFFSTKTMHAEAAGAIGVIVVNGGETTYSMAPGTAGPFGIPSVMMGVSDGDTIKMAMLSDDVNGTMNSSEPGTDNSVRWLIGEEAGQFRDMWHPICLASPGKVTGQKSVYICGFDGFADNGGVHVSSGIPNHAYALLVDGGTYNGHTVNSIGFNRALAIVHRAKYNYQHMVTNFADHADALEQACSDLKGKRVRDLLTGKEAEQVEQQHCDAVANAMLAVEMREPEACSNSTAGLIKATPDQCPVGTHKKKVFTEEFLDNPLAGRWSASHVATDPSFTQRDWVVTREQAQLDGLPGNFPSETPVMYGSELAFFNLEGLVSRNDCFADQSAVLHLDSPVINIPNNGLVPKVVFQHWLNLLSDSFPPFGGYDGAHVFISVNGGDFVLVPGTSFTFNGYNSGGLFPATFFGDPDNSNPLAGAEGDPQTEAFMGGDTRDLNPFYDSHIDLGIDGLAGPGDRIQLRFTVSTDFCTPFLITADGWFINEVEVYQCRP